MLPSARVRSFGDASYLMALDLRAWDGGESLVALPTTDAYPVIASMDGAIDIEPEVEESLLSDAAETHHPLPLPSTPEPQPERAPGGGKHRPDPIALPQELRQSTPAASPQQRRGTPLANGKGVALSVNGEVVGREPLETAPKAQCVS